MLLYCFCVVLFCSYNIILFCYCSVFLVSYFVLYFIVCAPVGKNSICRLLEDKFKIKIKSKYSIYGVCVVTTSGFCINRMCYCVNLLVVTGKDHGTN